MQQGYTEHIQYRAFVTTAAGPVLSFSSGAASSSFQFSNSGDAAPIIHAKISRKIGEIGRLIIALPQRSAGAIGLPWSWTLRANDPIEFEATVQRNSRHQELEGGFSQPWRNVFFGFIENVEETEAMVGESFQRITLITCVDQLGILNQNHFTYWRKLGEVLDGSADAEVIAKLTIADNSNNFLSQITAATIANAAELLLTGLIYSRISFRRAVRTSNPLFFSEMHSYRIESDGYATSISLQMVAPEATSWLESLKAVTDAPAFTEIFMDNVHIDSVSQSLAPTASGQAVGRTSEANQRLHKAPINLLGLYTEMLAIRPLPFPTYVQGVGYDSAAWDALPIIYAVPEFGVIKTTFSRTSEHLFSVFSSNIYAFWQMNDNAAQISDAYSQLTADVHKLCSLVGYKAMDVPTRRTPAWYSGPTQDVSQSAQQQNAAEFVRRLAWQLLSYHQLNDLFMTGNITVPLDLRARLGQRYVTDDMMYYIDGYEHDFGEGGGCSTTYSVCRGLPVEMYGGTPLYRKVRTEWQDYVKNYLGRLRPGEQYPPAQGRDILNLSQDTGVQP